MKFPNAFAGLKKVFIAEILALIASAATLLALFFGVLLVKSAEEGSATGGVASLSATAIFGIAAAVLAIIALVYKILGLNAGQKDEPMFKYALYFTYVELFSAVIKGIFTAIGRTGDTVYHIADISASVAGILAIYYVITGIMSLAEKLGNEPVKKRGSQLLYFILGILVLQLIASILGSFALTDTAGNIVNIVAAVLSIVQIVLYVLYINTGKKIVGEATE